MVLTNWKRALGLGFLSWLLPYLFAFAVYPIKRTNAPLFETVMSIVVVLVLVTVIHVPVG